MKHPGSLLRNMAGDQEPASLLSCVLAALFCAGLALPHRVLGASKPVRLAQMDVRPRIVRLPEASHIGVFPRYQGDSQEVVAIYSADNSPTTASTSWT